MFFANTAERGKTKGIFANIVEPPCIMKKKVPDQKDVAVQKGGGIDIAQASSSQAVLVQSPPKGTGANKRNPPLFFVIICLLAVVVGIYLFTKF